jgi:hypothetical protein
MPHQMETGLFDRRQFCFSEIQAHLRPKLIALDAPRDKSLRYRDAFMTMALPNRNGRHYINLASLRIGYGDK